MGNIVKNIIIFLYGDSSYTYGGHFVIYIIVALLCCILEDNIMYTNYISIKMYSNKNTYIKKKYIHK